MKEGSEGTATLATLLLLLNLMAFMARANVSVALPFIADDLGWGTEQLGELGGLLLGVFLIGFGPSNVLMGPLVDHFGTRVSMLLSLALFSLLTLLTGALGAIYSAFLALRFLVGAAQGAITPSASGITKARFPPSARGRVNALFLGSGYLANLLAPLLLIPLIQVSGWEAAFYAVGAAGLILMLPLSRTLSDGGRGPNVGRGISSPCCGTGGW